MEFGYVRGTRDWTHDILVVLANGGGKVGRGLKRDLEMMPIKNKA